MRSYRLAPMSPLIFVLTLALLALPVWLAVRGLLGPALVVGLLWMAVFVWGRPTRFALDRTSLVVRWPGRTRRIERADIVAVHVLSKSELRQRFGWLVRIGVGGLWGQFGWAWTSRAGLIDTYISTLGPFLLIEIDGARPLLITPESVADLRDELI
jgi:hypothetical protein